MQTPERSFGEGHGCIPYVELFALSDEMIMQELQAGNTDAFAIVFIRYHRLVHVVALQILRDAAEAEDLTQAVFLEVYGKAGQFDPARGTVKRWLLKYTYSRSINRRNYLLVRQRYGECELHALEGPDNLWAPTRPPLQEVTRLTGEVLATLPEAQRQTITLFFFEGLTLKEIAQKRNETFSNVRHHYYRGMDRLRSVLQDGTHAEDTRQSDVSLGEIRRAET